MYHNIRNRLLEQAMQSTLEFRVYGFKEVATLYFPLNTPATASRALKKIIREDPVLLHGLLERGYHAPQRTLTPAQIVYIIEILGSPKEFFEICHDHD